MKSWKFVMHLIPSLLSFSIQGEELVTPWQNRHAEGWAWYHDRAQKEEIQCEQELVKDPVAILAEAKLELENALALAMLEPNQKNILEYITLQKKWTNQAADFSSLWQLTVLDHPELASLHPTTQYGVQVRKKMETAMRKAFILDLSQKTILLFFYEGGNAFSQAFVTILKDFASSYKWAIKAVSVDGLILKDFPQSLLDRTIANDMNVNFFPSLFIVNPQTLKAKPIAYGMATVSQIEENILMQFREE